MTISGKRNILPEIKRIRIYVVISLKFLAAKAAL